MQTEDATALAMIRSGYALDDETDQHRVLTFRAGFNEVENAFEAIRAIGSYNGFDGEAVAQALETANTERARIQVGREGSPVVYIDGLYPNDQVATVKLALEQANADEIDEVRPGTVRGWWD